MASEVGSAFVSIVPSARGFGAKLGRELDGPATKAGDLAGRKSGSRFKSSFVGGLRGLAGPMAAAIGVAAVAGLMRGAIQGASDLAESASKVNVVFGDQAAAVLKASETSAKAMGLSKQGYLEATGTLGNLLVSLDLAPKKAAGLSQEMVALAGDLASFNNISTDEALIALRAGLTGETEPLKRLGVNMNEATLKAQALKMGLVKTTKEALTPQAKALAAHALIMDQTGTAQGDFARTSGGLANQQRILSAQFTNMKATIGGALLPVVTTMVATFNNDLVPALSSVGSFLSSNIGTVKIVAALISAVLVPALIIWGVQSTIAAGKSVAAWLAAQFGAVRSAAVQVAAAVRVVAGWVMQGVSALGTLAAYVVVYAFMGAAAVKNAAVHVLSAARVVAGWVLMGVQSLLAAAKVAAAWLIAMGPVAIVIAIVVGLAVLIYKNWDKIKKFTAAAWDWIVGKLKAAAQGIVNLFMRYHPVGIILSHWDQIKSGVASRAGALVNFVKGIPKRILDSLGNLGSLLLNAGKDIIRGLIDGIKDAGKAIGAVLVGLLPGPLRKFAGKLGLASPSKLFRYYGEMTGVGYAQGVAGTRGQVDAAIQSLVSRPSFGSLDMGSAADRAAAASRTYNVTLNAAPTLPTERQLVDVMGRVDALYGR